MGRDICRLRMITQYGMSEKFGAMGLESIQNRYLDGTSVKNCSPETQTQIDEEVRLTLESCQREANGLLENNRGALDKIAEYLLDKENITGEEFMGMLEPRSYD